MSIVESKPLSMTEQAVNALQSFSPMVDQVLSYANFTVAEDGIGRVEEAHKAVKRLRIDLDKKREELNKGALTYQRTVNATAKFLTEKITVVEERLEKERAAYDAEKLKEKQAKEAAKAAVLNERVSRLSVAGIPVTDLAAIGAMAPDEFEFFFAKESRLAAEAKAESERLEALRAAELTRQAEELRVRAEEVERQRLADEAAMREQREAMEAERAEMRRQRELFLKQQDELREKAEAEAAEQRRIEKEAEIARREAAAAPELEKLEMVLQVIRDAAGKAVVNCGEPAWCVHLDEALTKLASDMRLVVRQGV